MAQVQIRDTSLWTKHVLDPAVRRRLEALAPGQTIWLRVAGERGRFEKMRPGPHGPMQGLKPVGEARELWRELYPARRGELVEISVDDDPSAPAAAPPVALPRSSRAAPRREREESTDEEREAAWAAFKALTRAGWRSEAPASAGTRDELHER